MVSGISLANKIQLLFGFAVAVILTAALSVPWLRTQSLVRNFQIEEARRIADAWLGDRIELGLLAGEFDVGDDEEDEDQALLRLTYISIDHMESDEDDDDGRFASAAIQAFHADPLRQEFARQSSRDGRPLYRYARAVRESHLRGMRKPAFTVFSGPPVEPGVFDPLRAILVVDRSTRFAEGQLLQVRAFIVAAGLGGTMLAILTFYFILTKLIFRPVRGLRETSESVQAGNLSIRSNIRTGDEFEQLAEAFNSMLDRMEAAQSELRAANQSLDLRIDALAEANTSLAEANRIKSEFLASVSHELRTPLNSIIGFAELLQDLARSEPDADPKRIRYLTNIVTSGRSLLEMINELLDMAKIEAGRMEVNIEQTSLPDMMEGLIRSMRPQAESKEIDLSLSIGPRLPVVETDAGKVQQILYNYLSNAIKFTPRGGRVVLSADRVNRADHQPGIRLSVSDTGPGIPEDMHEVIFEKFRQLDASHTREHTGTGLGLAICRELADMLGAGVSFVSSADRGSTFFVDLPLTYRPKEPKPLMG